MSESGIRNADDVKTLMQHGIHAVLMGEHFMRSPDPGAELRTLIAETEASG